MVVEIVGSESRHFVHTEQDLVRRVRGMGFPAENLKSVIFIGGRKRGRTSDDIRLCGTAFVTFVPSDDQLIRHPYLVTNKHVLDGLSREREQCVLRMNTIDGGVKQIAAPLDEWRFHPTEEESVDVAVRPFYEADYTDLDFGYVEPDRFLRNRSVVDDYYIGPGDTVYMTGLFTRVSGKKNNVPIVRTGTLAMMPDDKVRAKFSGRSVFMEVYLVEMRSTGGLSGSPVWITTKIGFPANAHTRSGKRRDLQVLAEGDYHFLGIVRSHWETKSDGFNSVDIKDPAWGDQTINMGIALVVPAGKIAETLEAPELVAMRKQAEDEICLKREEELGIVETEDSATSRKKANRKKMRQKHPKSDRS